jgi:hypothetical protein
MNRLGAKLSEEHKRKIGEAAKGKKYMLGKKFSEETKRKMSESHIGEKHWNWKGGFSYQPYPEDWTDILRDSIRQRDNYICQICGIHQDELTNIFKVLDVHHIDYDKDNLCPSNLVSLCKSCHIKTNFKRENWIESFNGRIL